MKKCPYVIKGGLENSPIERCGKPAVFKSAKSDLRVCEEHAKALRLEGSIEKL